MNNEKNDIKTPVTTSYYRPSIDRFRLVLMCLFCFQALGLPTVYGKFGQVLLGFVPTTFFLVSGYLVLRDSPNRSKRILRTIKRTAITFLVLLVCYFILNIIFFALNGKNAFVSLLSWRTWFEFLVLNIWPYPIGTTIWYVEALLIAYIIIYFLDKFNLLRFSVWIFAALMLLNILSGEFSTLIGLNLFGYKYLGGNFLTRALPYILLGNIMHQKMSFFTNLNRSFYVGAIIGSAILCVLEVFFLGAFKMTGYYSHLLGFPFISIALFMLFLPEKENVSELQKSLKLERQDINVFYYVCQPIGFLIVTAVAFLGKGYFWQISQFTSVITLVISFYLCMATSYLRRYLKEKKSNENKT